MRSDAIAAAAIVEATFYRHCARRQRRYYNNIRIGGESVCAFFARRLFLNGANPGARTRGRWLRSFPPEGSPFRLSFFLLVLVNSKSFPEARVGNPSPWTKPTPGFCPRAGMSRRWCSHCSPAPHPPVHPAPEGSNFRQFVSFGESVRRQQVRSKGLSRWDIVRSFPWEWEGVDPVWSVCSRTAFGWCAVTFRRLCRTLGARPRT